jgi:hypothetical protein
MAILGTDGQPQLTVRHPKKRSMRFFKFNGSDISWTVFCAAIAFYGSTVIGNQINRIFFVACFVVWILSMLPAEKLNDRIYSAPYAALDNLRIRLNKNYTWRASSKDSLGTRLRNVRIMMLSVQSFGDLGLIYNRKADTYSVVFSSEGSPISSQNMVDQYASHEAIASIFTKAAAVAKVSLRVSTGVRTRPDDPWEYWDMVSMYGEVEVVLTEAEVTQKREEDYTEYDHRMQFLQTIQFAQAEHILGISNDIDMVMVMTIRGTSAFKKALKDKTITEEELSAQPISKVIAEVLPLLAEVVDDQPVVLDGEGAERYLRKAHDVFTLGDYYNVAHDRKEKGNSVQLDQWYPKQFIKQFKDYLQIDETYGATLKVTSYPREETFPTEARIFYASHARYFANSVIGETQHGRWAYRFLNFGSGVGSAVLDQVGIDTSDPKSEEREAKRTSRLREINESVYIQDYSPIIGVSGVSLEDLEYNLQREADRLAALGMETVRVVGERNQLKWYLSATTLIDLT